MAILLFKAAVYFMYTVVCRCIKNDFSSHLDELSCPLNLNSIEDDPREIFLRFFKRRVKTGNNNVSRQLLPNCNRTSAEQLDFVLSQYID